MIKYANLGSLNFSAIAGLIGALGLLSIAIGATASDPWSFLNLPSAIVVVGGTLAATLVTYSPGEVWRALTRFGGFLRYATVVDRTDAGRLVRIAGEMKSGKLQAAERELDEVKSPFLRTGLRLLVDGMPADAIQAVLDWRMKQQEALELKEAAVFRTMATYAPAFGMAGTLIGLVNMLRLMGNGATPEMIGTNLGFALITTFYGLVLSNAILKPIAAKIESKAQDHLRVMAAVAEAFREIGQGHGPSHVREVLAAISEHHENEMNSSDELAANAYETSDAANAKH